MGLSQGKSTQKCSSRRRKCIFPNLETHSSVRKNHKVVVQALQELPEDYWYVIVGKGDLKLELEELDYTGRLRLLGYRTDIVDLLHCANIFVFPSLHEGLAVALMEAMAAGLPCIASRIRGNIDLLPKSVENTTNVDEWKEAVECTHDTTLLDVEFSREKINNYMKALYENICR